ncbi:hypothetical protein TNCV_2266891 [Trichonephila clavipes]|nr:hypothetical protein TNCV_2266891 [Trichonephila clavipes]
MDTQTLLRLARSNPIIARRFEGVFDFGVKKSENKTGRTPILRYRADPRAREYRKKKLRGDSGRQPCPFSYPGLSLSQAKLNFDFVMNCEIFLAVFFYSLHTWGCCKKQVLKEDADDVTGIDKPALIEEQNVKLNQIANDERTGLSPLHTETSVISALTNKLEEINLRSSVYKRPVQLRLAKQVGSFSQKGDCLQMFYCGLEGHKQTECRRKRAEERQSNYQPPWGNGEDEFSVIRHPNTHSFDQRRVYFHDSAFHDNYTAPRHSETAPQRTSRGRGNTAGFRRNKRNDNLNFREESRF